MQILAHRGYWKDKSEHNTLNAFRRALQMGFGVETDIRDQNGELVISHDMAEGSCITFRTFLDLHKSENPKACLALNLKAMELAKPFQQILAEYRVTNYFLFDTSVPDSLKFIRHNLVMFSRHSDIEPSPALYTESKGIWMDEMLAPWITEAVISEHLVAGKKVCIVSPELHERAHQNTWKICRNLSKNSADESLMICTDFPEQFREYLNA